MNDPVLKLMEDFKLLNRAEQSRVIELILRFIKKRCEEEYNGKL